MSTTRSQWRIVVTTFVVCALLVAGIVDAINLTHQIQEQRHHACVDQNRRYANSIALLNRVRVAELRAAPKKRASIEHGYAQLATLIRDLAPPQNCDASVSGS